MYYYYVNKIGEGSEENPFQPNIPSGTAFVGNITIDDMYLVATSNLIPNFVQVTDLPSFCQSHGLSYEDVLKWNVGDGV